MVDIPVVSLAGQRRDRDRSGTISRDELLQVRTNGRITIEERVAVLCDPLTVGQMTSEAMAARLADDYSREMQGLLQALPEANLSCAKRILPALQRRWGKTALRLQSTPHKDREPYKLFGAAEMIMQALWNYEEYEGQCPTAVRADVRSTISEMFVMLFPGQPPPHLAIVSGANAYAYSPAWIMWLGSAIVCPDASDARFSLHVIIGHESGHFYFGHEGADDYSAAGALQQSAADVVGWLLALTHDVATRRWFATHQEIWGDEAAWIDREHPHHAALYDTIGWSPTGLRPWHLERQPPSAGSRGPRPDGRGTRGR